MDQFIINTIAESCRSIGRVNTKTSMIYPYKEMGLKYPEDAEGYSIAQYLDLKQVQGHIFEEDMWNFRIMQLPLNLIQAVIREGSGSSFLFRRREEGKLVWSRLTMLLPDDFGEENPNMLYICHDVSQKEALRCDAQNNFLSCVHKIIKIDFAEKTLLTLKEYPAEQYLHQKAKNTGFSMELQFVKDKFVHPDDEQGFLTHMSHNYISDYFNAGNTRYIYHYRRRVGTLYRWVKAIVLPSDEWTRDHQVYYYYILDDHQEILKMMDINNIMNYADYFSKWDASILESYYDNILVTLSSFTEKYLDYFLIDLDRDLCIRYKIQSANRKENVSYVGTYSQSIPGMVKANIEAGAEAEKVLQFLKLSNLKELMKHKMTFELDFRDHNGDAMRLMVRKQESYRGEAVKLVCYILPREAGTHKLKVQTFGNFAVWLPDGKPLKFMRQQSRQLFAYLIDRQGYPVTSGDIVADILEKDTSDKNAVKYVSTLVRRTMLELEQAGFPDVLVKETKSIHVNTKLLDCDYYRLLAGDETMWEQYHNEYMKEYSWAEETNAELLAMAEA